MDEDGYVEKKIPPGVWVFWIVIGTAVVIAIAAWSLKDNPNKYAYIQTVVLALTLIVVAWYTYVTAKMQQEVKRQAETAVRQVNISILPVFVAQIHLEGRYPLDPQPEPNKLVITNIGNGSAFNIQVDPVDIELGFNAPNMIPAPNLTFQPLICLRPGEKGVVKHKANLDKTGQGEVTNNIFFDWLKQFADSSSKCNQWLFEIDLVRRLVRERLAWPIIKALHHMVKLGVCDRREVRLLREVLPH